MVKHLSIAALIFFAFSSFCCAGADIDMQEGLWEMTTKTEMPGMPANIPPMKQTQCITKKDMIPQNQQQTPDCKITQSKVEGNTVTWAMKCSGGEAGDAEGTGKITYSGDKFEGSFSMEMQSPEQGKIKMISKMSGKRVGPCK